VIRAGIPIQNVQNKNEAKLKYNITDNIQQIKTEKKNIQQNVNTFYLDIFFVCVCVLVVDCC
jgi:hypothetical protein